MADDVAALVAAAQEGRPRAVARLISQVENASSALRDVMSALAPHTGRARVVGLTGAPGVGKSTTTSALVGAFRARGERVGVLAVDPSSPFTGGALLGDRIRMTEHTLDEGVYIRSMSSRGHLGGLSWATPHALRVLDAAGCDVVVVETVGVGQSEVDIAGLADTTVVLLAPGMGDGVQAAKAGILEIGDVYAVNKADRDGVDATVRELEHMIALGREDRRRHGGAGEGDGGAGEDDDEAAGWEQPVVRTVASTGEGVDGLVAALDEHHAWLTASGELTRRRRRRAAEEVEAVALQALRSRMTDVRSGSLLRELAAEVADGRTDPYSAADRVLAALA